MTKGEIICATDLEEDSIYIEKIAYEFAKKFNFKLKLIHVHKSASLNQSIPSSSNVIFSLNFWEKINQQLVAYKARKLSHRIHSMEAAADSRVSFEIITSLNPASAILEYAEDANRKVELIVLGKQRRSYFDEFLLGSVAQEIISCSKTPTFLIPSSDDLGIDWQPLQFTIATDLSENSKDAINFSAKLAKVFGAKLKLVHVLKNLNYYNDLSFISLNSNDADNLEYFFDSNEIHAQRFLEKIAAEIDFPLSDISIRILKGKPTEQILNETHHFNLNILTIAQGRDNSSLVDSLARSTRTPLLTIPENLSKTG